jgi:hypothetical protein
MSAADQALCGELEYGTQLLRRAEIGYHLGEQDQPMVAAQIILGGEDVTLNYEASQPRTPIAHKPLRASGGIRTRVNGFAGRPP